MMQLSGSSPGDVAFAVTWVAGLTTVYLVLRSAFFLGGVAVSATAFIVTAVVRGQGWLIATSLAVAGLVAAAIAASAVLRGGLLDLEEEDKEFGTEGRKIFVRDVALGFLVSSMAVIAKLVVGS